MRTTSRSAGLLATVAIAGAALILPSVVLAQEGNQTGPITWDDASQSCTGGPNGNITVGPDEAGWLFVHAGVSGSGTLTATYQAPVGVKNAASYIQGNVKYLVITPKSAVLMSFSDTIAGGVLTLSHVCVQPTPTPTPTVEPTPTPTEEPTPTPTEEPTPTVEPTPTPTVEPTPTPTTEPTPTPTTEPTPTPTTTPETEETPTPTPSGTVVNSTPTPTPSGTVEQFTSTPRITPPSTDGVQADGGSTPSGGLPIVLLALAGVIASSLVLLPRRNKR